MYLDRVWTFHDLSHITCPTNFLIFGMVNLGCQLNGIWNNMPLGGSVAAFPGIINWGWETLF